MASTHKSLRSSTADKRPTTAIADGQIALNTNSTSPGLFFKDSTGATIIKVGPVHVGTTAPNATPAAGGSSGNSTGEVWLDTSLTPPGVKIWNGGAWVNGTPAGSTTVQGLLELATNAETQAGSDTARAVTPASLQSKVSDSTSTTSSTTIASSTAVKSAYDLANAALPKAGGTVTGTVTFGTTGVLAFEGSTDDGFETVLGAVDPTADNTINLPNVSGTVVTTGDTGSVTGTMIASGTVTSTNIVDGTIVDADINASAEIAVSKLADGSARQLLQTDAAGTGVEWTSNVDVPGTLDVTSTATFDGIISSSAGAAATPSITFTGDLNTGIYSPGADQVAISTNGTGRLFIDSNGRITNVGTGLQINYGGYSDVTFTDPGSGNNIYLLTYAPGNAFFLGSNNGATFHYGWGSSSTSHVWHTGSSNERMRLDSSGRLGLGTSSPSNTLHVNSGTTNGVALFESTDVGANITLTDSVGSSIIETTDTQLKIGVDPNNTVANSDLRLQVDGSTKLLIDSSGRVGIGTTSPQSPLHVIGADGAASLSLTGGATTAAVTQINAVSANALSWNQLDIRGYQITFDTNSLERARIDSSGRLGLGTSVPDSKLVIQQNSSDTNPLDQNSPSTSSGLAVRNYNFGVGTYTALSLETADSASVQSASIIAQSVSGGLSPNILFTQRTASNVNTTRMVIDSSGNVGIGTTSVSNTLHIANQANHGITLERTVSNPGSVTLNVTSFGAADFKADNTFNIQSGTSAPIVFFTSGTNERARIDSSGRLLVGTSTSVAIGGVADGTLQMVGTRASFARYSNNEFSTNISLGKSRGTTPGTYTIVNSNDSLGAIEFVGADGVDLQTVAAQIEAFVDGTPGANDMPGRLVFSTTEDGASSPTERMRIDSSGRLLVGNTSSVSVGGFTANLQNHTTLGAVFNGATYVSLPFGPVLALGKSRGTTVGSFTVVQDNDQLGVITFSGADGTDLNTVGASIQAEVDGTPGANDMPGRLVFSTTADGASSPTERMRIKNDGTINFSNVAVYADNAAAKTGGLVDGDVYRTSTGDLKIVYT